jgi:hypothetical protein
MNETPEERRRRIEGEVAEDLGKRIDHLLADIHEESVQASPTEAPLTRTMARFASLLAVLSIRADIQTGRIIRLTRALVGLTVALLLFTAYLSYDAYLNSKRVEQGNKNASEEQKSDSKLAHGLPLPF